MYIRWEDVTRDVVVIDPGEQDEVKLLDFFLKTKLKPAWVFLTHEHFDHCAGVNTLNRYYDFQLFTTFECNHKIRDQRGNLSLYAEGYCEPFVIEMPVRVVSDSERILINGKIYEIIITPGHSAGGMCVKVENYLFSGDSLLETKVPVKLPGGNKLQLQESLQRLKDRCDPGVRVYPGHGECFAW